MALGDFDSNQSSFEFGQSLLADKDRRDKKARKRQKKMKNVSYLLGTVAVADMFMANKARKKAELFQENLLAEKAGVSKSKMDELGDWVDAGIKWMKRGDKIVLVPLDD